MIPKKTLLKLHSRPRIFIFKYLSVFTYICVYMCVCVCVCVCVYIYKIEFIKIPNSWHKSILLKLIIIIMKLVLL